MVSVGGLASGIDTQGILTKLLEIERRPIAQLQSRVSDLQRFQAAYSGLAGVISDLRSAAQGLSEQALTAASVSSSAPDLVGVSASSKALSGSHDIVVRQLAAAHRIGSQGVADPGATPIASSSGTFTLQLGSAGAQIAVAVNAQTTLNDLAQAINSAGGGVTASVVNDGTKQNAHRLVLSSSKTGTANMVRVVSNPTNLNFSGTVVEAAAPDDANSSSYTGTASSSGTYTGEESKTYIVQVLIAGHAGNATYRYSDDGGITWDDNAGAGFTTSEAAAALGNEGVQIGFSDSGTLSAGDTFYVDVTAPTLQRARDAVFSLDGINQTRSTNSVSDALQGVTLDLKKADSEQTVSFSVSRPDSNVVDKATALVKAYNALGDAVRKQQTYSAEDKVGGLLLGDATANALLTRLHRALVEPVAGVSGGPKTLLDLGFSTDKSGKLSLDEGKLKDQLSSDREGVLRVLGSSAASSSSQLTVSSRPPGLKDGSYEVYVTQAPAKGLTAASAAMSEALAADEHLSFTYTAEANATNPKLKTFSVSLAAGDNLTQTIDKLNSAFATQSVRLRAFQSGGALQIETSEYGSGTSFTAVSDVAAGSGTTRIGTSQLSGRGVDIRGTIDGQSATGLGATLTGGTGGALEGFVVRYEGAATGFVGTIDVSTGAGSRFESLVKELNSGDKSLLGARDKALQKQIDSINDSITHKDDQISKVEARLKAQFVAMETALGAIKAQGDFLTNQLAALAG